MSRSPLLRVLAALLPCLAAVPLQAQAGPEVVELRFEGASSFTRAQLASAIATAPTRCPDLLLARLCWFGLKERAYLDRATLEADAFRLRAFYYERGYRQADVRPELEPADDGVRVVFRIAEGIPVRVREVDVRGAPAGIAERALPLRTGDRFDMVAYEAGRDTLLTRLRNGGYARAQVLLGYGIAQDDPYRARVEYEVVPGAAVRIGEIRVVGTESSSPELVRRMLTFREGARYDRSALLESQRNLYRLQIYRHAEVQAHVDEEPDTVIPVTVQVAEGPMRRVRVGGGLNTIECGNVEGRWTSRNFLGGGRRLDLRGRLGNLLVAECRQYLDALWTLDQAYDSLTGLASIEFSQPWFFGPRNTVGGGLFAERRSLPEVFVRSAVGGYLSVGRSLGRGTVASLGYRPELTELRTEGDLFFCVNFIACAYEENIGVLRAPHWLSPVMLSLTADRSDGVFSPSSGYILRADLEHAAEYTGSDFAYTRLLGELSRYGGQPGRLVVAARVRGGIGWPDRSTGTGLNPQKRFFAGGANSVRGFDQYRLGPTVLGIDAVEWLADVDDPATATVEGAGCSVAEINDGSCDAGVLATRPGAFVARPAGGEVLLEGNVEVRFPLPVGGGKLRGAAFLDAGQVWATTELVSLTEIVPTPGLGVRYYSPVGPIRIDAGFNLQGPRSLQVLTTRVEDCVAGSEGCVKVPRARTTLRNTDDIVVLANRVEYQPYSRGIDTLAGILQRFQLHFSIGQAF